MMHPVIAWIMLYVLQIFLPLQMINTGIDDRVRDFANTTENSKYRTVKSAQRDLKKLISTSIEPLSGTRNQRISELIFKRPTERFPDAELV